MGDELRVTVVATGLGQLNASRMPKPQLVVSQKTGTDNIGLSNIDYASLEAMPAVMRKRDRASTIEALQQSGMPTLDIPAFLRKQAD